jgi:hypothetical protein
VPAGYGSWAKCINKQRENPTQRGVLALYTACMPCTAWISHAAWNITVGHKSAAVRAMIGGRLWASDPARPVPPRPTHCQPIGGEQRDPGQEREKAQIDDKGLADSLIASHPYDDAADETARMNKL